MNSSIVLLPSLSLGVSELTLSGLLNTTQHLGAVTGNTSLGLQMALRSGLGVGFGLRVRARVRVRVSQG